MEVNTLQSEELTYELYIRRLPVTSTVQEKRMMLRDALRLERLGEVDPPVSANLNPALELSLCKTKLNALEVDIAQFDYSNRENEFKRINSRLIHVSLRISRIATQEQS